MILGGNGVNLNKKSGFCTSGKPKIYLHQGDLPEDVSFLNPNFKGAVAIDTEAMGLKVGRDRLCLVQLSQGDGICHLVQIKAEYSKEKSERAPRLKKLLENQSVLKIFHFARFDIAGLKCYLDVEIYPIFCTKIASKLSRTFTDKHSLKELCKNLLKVDISKEEGMSDWGADVLTPEQLTYAATDVLYLHALKERLEVLLKREGRYEIAQSFFSFLPTLSELDYKGFNGEDILRH